MMKHKSASPPRMPPIMGPRSLFAVDEEAGAEDAVEGGILVDDAVDPVGDANRIDGDELVVGIGDCVLEIDEVVDSGIVADDTIAELVVVLLLLAVVVVLLELVVPVETVKVCAATFNCDVNVSPNGASTPPPVGSGTSAAWQATGKSLCAGSWFVRTYPNRPVVTTGD